MKILVFGAAGQVGREVRRAARPALFELLTIDKSASDVTDPHAVSTVIAQQKPDLVINLAAYTAVDRAEREPEITWARANHIGKKTRSAPSMSMAAARRPVSVPSARR